MINDCSLLVEEGGLAGAGSARDEDIESRRHQGAQQVRGLLGQAAARHKIREAEGLGKAADGDRRSIEGERRDNDVDALAAGQAGVHHGAGLVHAAVDRGDDAVDDLVELGLGGEAGLAWPWSAPHAATN